MEEIIKRVPLKSRKLESGFISNDGSFKIAEETKEQRKEAAERQQLIAKTYNELMDENKVQTSQIWQAARTPNAFSVNAQQALEPFMNLKAKQKQLFFDIEAIGTPKHLSTKGGIDMFAITELSFGGTEFNGKEFVRDKSQIVSMAVAPGEGEYMRMKEQINQLKKNPLAVISKDMHRSLLDLTKYSDASKLQSTTKNGGRLSHQGLNYTSISGHARSFSPDSAMTENVLREVQRGLDNLYEKGTPAEQAMSILRKESEASKAALSGYNIHAYDMPAMMGASSNKENLSFFEKSMKTSLDFYHGYTATQKNPYELTGGTLRQEHIHQKLLKSKKIDGAMNPSEYLYHLAKHDIQANIEIAGLMTSEINKSNVQAKKIKDYEFSPSRVKRKALMADDTLFSFQSGFYDPKKHKHNMVARQVTDKDGKTTLQPRWSELNTPIPSNENFRINEFMKDVTLPGTERKGHGVRLDSLDITGKSMLLFSETEAELAQQLHGSFLTVDKAREGQKKTTEELRTIKIRDDAAFREYEKMFDTNGFNNMEKYYDLLDSGKKQEGTAGFSWADHVLSKNSNDETLALKFPHMVNRLEGERDIWDPVRKSLNGSRLNDDQKTAALWSVKQELDSLGNNKAEVQGSGNRFFNFNFGGDDNALFNAKNSEQIKSSFRSYVKGGRRKDRVGEAEQSYKVQRARELGELINSNFGFNTEGPEAKKVKALANGLISEVQSGGKIETVLTGMANFVRDHVETKGKSGFVREVTNEVTSVRKQAISNLQKNLPDVIQRSIDHGHTLVKAENAFSQNSVLGKFAREQDARIEEIFVKNFHINGKTDKSLVRMEGKKASKYEELMGGILSSYSNDFNTQIHFREDGSPLLVLGDKKSNVNLGSFKTYEELVTNAKVATIELPRFGEDGLVHYGSNKKAAIMRSGMNKKKGVQYHSTSVTDSLSMILNYAEKAKAIKNLTDVTGQKNAFVQIQKGINYRVGKQVNPVQTYANKKVHYDDKTMYDAKNAIGAEMRSSKWDVTGYAESWYGQNASRLGIRKSVDEVSAIATAKNISFFEAMDGRAKGFAMAGGLLEYANQSSNLKGSMFGINNRSAGRGVVGTQNSDARTYMALGNYYTDSVENPHKTVNYRKVDGEYASKALSEAGKNHSFRTKNSFISDRADEVLSRDNEIRGITVQSGYMTDEEVAHSLKDKEKVAKYKSMIEKSDASPAMKRQMVRALDMGMLSTSEGLAFMDHRLMKAFEGKEDVRINMTADKVLFNNSIEEAIEKEAKKQGLGDGLWKEKGIQFEKPITINNLDDMLDNKDKLTLGKYWMNGIESSILDEKRFRKGDAVSILGFNAEAVGSKSLVLAREREVGHGFKAVTEGGFRATMTPMLQGVMEDMYGVKGVEQIQSHLPSKKGATDLPSLIRGYDTQIRQHFNGSIKTKLTGFKNEEEALSALYKDVETTMGIKTTNKDGQYLVSSEIGRDGESLNRGARDTFSKNWQRNLGIDKEVFADITMAHDVWDRQGGKERGKMTVKELDMIDRAFKRTEIYAPGQTSEYSKFLRDEIYGNSTTKEIKIQQKAFAETVKAAGNYENGWTPKAGDAVIDYTAEGFGMMNDVNAENRNGILNVSKDAFSKIPEVSGHKQVFTIGDYNKTVINASRLNVVTEGGSSGKSLQSHLGKKGTAYMKLPDFANNQYLPLIDVDSMMLPRDTDYKEKVQFLDSMKGHYASIARKTDEYNGLFANKEEDTKIIADRKRELETQINDESARLMTTFGDSTSKDGMAKIMSRRLPMSTQLQFGGVNAAAAYTKKDNEWVNSGAAKEGEIYMNRNDIQNLIGDKAENIAKTWKGEDNKLLNVETLGADTERAKGESDADFRKRKIDSYVMDNWNKHDTFSTTIRYPSIDVGTSQALKIKMDDAVGKGQVVGLRGMAERISGDFDGDNLAVFLSHYGIDDDKRRSAVLGDIEKMHVFDKAKNNLAADVIMNDMEKGFRKRVANEFNLSEGHQSVIDASNNFFSNEGYDPNKLTLGGLHGFENKQAIDQRIRKSLHDDGNYEGWGTARSTEIEHERSTLARASSTTIGSVDNTRMRMSAAYSTIAETKYKLFNKAEEGLRYSQQDYVRETAVVDEFLREYSQKAISAKKTEGSVHTAEDIMGGLYSMIDKVNSPGGADYDTIAQELVGERGLFKDKPFLEIGEGEVYKGSSQKFVSEALQLLGGAEDIYKEMGIPGYRASSLLTAASQGIGFHGLSNMVKTGEHIPELEANQEIGRIANEHGNERMVKYQGLFEESVERIHVRKSKNIEQRMDDADSMYDIMNGQKVNAGINTNEGMPIHKTISGSLGTSLSELATSAKHSLSGPGAKFAGIAGAGFGALWATNSLMKPAPTPEGLQEMAPVPINKLTSPTARIQQNDNGEYLNIQVNAKSANQMNSNDLAAMLNNEILAMSNVQMKTSVNVNDNSQNIDNRWMEGAVANVMNKGYAY